MGGYTLKDSSSSNSFSKKAENEHQLEGMNGKYVSKVQPLDESGSSSGGSAEDETNSSTDDTKTEIKSSMVGFLEVFRFSTRLDCLLMVIGTISACLHGSAMPLMMIVFGKVTDTLIDQQTLGDLEKAVEWVVANLSDPSNPTYPRFENLTVGDITGDFNEFLKQLYPDFPLLAGFLEEAVYGEFMHTMINNSLYYIYIGCCVLVVGYLQMMCWRTSAYNQSERIRTALFRSILKQDIGWFDTHEAGELTNRLVDDVDLIEKGIGDKIALFFQYVSAFFSGFIVGFVFGWELTLVILSVSPLLAIAGGAMAKLMSSMTKKELAAYATAGAVAEEVLGSMRTVTAFSGQKKEVGRYLVNLKDAQKFGMRKGIVNGIGMGSVFLVMFCSYALAFWYGSSLVRENKYTAGDMLIVFFSVLMGAFSIGAASPNIQDFAAARGAANIVYNMIDLVPPIDSSSTEGLKPDKLIGNIEFKDVFFRYPSRSSVKILNGLNLKVNTGQTVALVGSSGCGKSTCIQLIQRFYDILSGTIMIDGIDIKDFNLKWLRQHIGVVSQEPVLFGTTIAENIRYGREDVTAEEIEKAAREANAHDFISNLPQKYETLVGERGAQLSGGQKQRIAIARALVRDPTILLLDEATSALDTESEATVQAALDKARLGRTTIVVAHRLSTIQTADIIAGVSEGVVVEQGTHSELMQKQGIYYILVTNQSQMQNAEQDTDEVKIFAPSSKIFERSVSRQNEKNVERKRTVSVSSNSEKTATKEKSEKEIIEEEKLEHIPGMFEIMKYNLSEWPLLVTGSFCAAVMGLIQPAFAIIFSSIIGVFGEPDLKYQEERCNFYSGMFAVIGVIAGLSNFGMFMLFGRSGEILTTRFRKMAFESLLRQDIAYFDDHQNGTGALCARLSTDAAAVKGATGSRLATLIQSVAALGVGIIIGFYYSWKLTLVVVGIAPFMLIGGYVEMQVFTGGRSEKNVKMEQAAKVATEAIENIRTVANLTKEDKFYQIYSSLVAIPYGTSRRKAHVLGIAYSYSQAIIFFANAIAFGFGAWLVRYDGLHYEDMFKVFTAVVFGAMAAGQASSFAPDYSKARLSAARMFKLLARVPDIDSYSEDGAKLESISGSVELKDVQFTYPTRPDIKILKGVSLTVKPGQMVALVGSSGCGKSTVVQLIERFYDPAAGLVLLDGHSTRDLHIQWLRRQIGIVSQEPILFDCSIRDNIAYGDNFREVTMDEIIAAAREANIHSFIEGLPQGYDTNVGDKGAQLSGGQKQRVAIARALIRSPKILLLDEATSALDTESEKVVQEALERAQKGRTSIVIAHRLSTIQNADCIVVVHNGLVAEVGTHSSLMEAQGYYYRLNSKQRSKANNAPPPVYQEMP